MSLFGRREDAPRERSREEREKARLEREARRAARRGDPPPFESEAPRSAQHPVELAAPQRPVEAPRAAPQRPVEMPVAEEVHGPPRSARVRRIPRAPTPVEDQPAGAPPPASSQPVAYQPPPPPAPEPEPEPVAYQPPPPPERSSAPRPRAYEPPPPPEPPRAPEPRAYGPVTDGSPEPTDWAYEPGAAGSSFGEVPTDPYAADGDPWPGAESKVVREEPEMVREEPEVGREEPEVVREESEAADTVSPSRLPEAPPLRGERAARRIPRARRVGGVGAPLLRTHMAGTAGRLRGRAAALDGGGDAEPSEPPAPGRAGPRRRMPTSRPVALALFLVPLVLVGWFLVSFLQPFAGEGGEPVSVRIPDGAGAGQIGTILAEEGVVDSSLFFRVHATLSGKRGALRSGEYDLRRGMSYGAAISALSTPPQAAPAPPVIEVTIPEGLSRQEIAPTVEQADIPGDYVEASVGQRGFKLEEEFEAPEDASLEGFLFPATYEVPREGNAEDLVSLQLEAFEDNVAQVDMAEAKRRNLTPYEVLVIASMVEREAQQPEERPLIAAVIHNRLRDGMPLGIDATIRYANDNWDRPLRQSELQADGPYNTRTRTGLPPTPIGNPGLDSIKAAANPADKDFLFYVVKPGTCGQHAFSSTDAQFQQDVARYNQARERAGGRSPTNC